MSSSYISEDIENLLILNKRREEMKNRYIPENSKKLMTQLLHVNELTANEEIKDMCLKAARYISNMEAYRHEVFCHTEAIKQQLDRIIE